MVGTGVVGTEAVVVLVVITVVALADSVVGAAVVTLEEWVVGACVVRLV